jgi:hypothetical protein
VLTTSERPLADDVASVIGRALATHGYRVSPAPATSTSSPNQIAAMAARMGATRVLAVTLVVWKSDTYMGTKLEYDVTARVLGVPDARVLGESRVAASADLGSAFWDPTSLAKRAVPEAYERTLEALLNAPAIVRALSETRTPPPGGAPASAPASGPGSA